MTEKPDAAQERASEEATDWLIQLQEAPDDTDLLRRFDAWRNKSPTNDAAWAATQHTANVIGATPPAYTELWGPFVAPRPNEKPRPPDTFPPRATAAPPRATAAPPRATAAKSGPARPARWRRALQVVPLAAAACLAVVLVPDLMLQIRADHTTGTAEIRTLHLEDGSLVTLAPDSAITVAYDTAKRRVNLLAGEAFFEAAPNPERPFQVIAHKVRATVLGTAFSVVRSDEGATVALQHGGVLVSHQSARPPVSEALEASQLVHVSWSGDVVRSSKPPSQIAAWRKGLIIAEDQPMEKIVDQLRRHYGGTIILADRALAHRPVTGVFNLTDPADALRAIAHAHGGIVRQITPWILVVSDI